MPIFERNIIRAMSTKPRKILVTTGLPYANGEIHLGHMVEQIQADIWVRFQKMKGNECLFISGDDAHGTAVSLRAEAENTTPTALIERLWTAHYADLKDFLIDYDNYYTTHSEENQMLVYDIFEKLKNAGAIYSKEIEQAYDPVKNLFLPDRYIKGNCPRCDAADQYGDNCEKCGAVYSPTELKNPRSTISDATPINKTSLHYFFDLPQYEKFLKKWTHEGTLSVQMSHKLNEWLQSGLQAWDISRDAPYFGFTIPGHTDKYFYVWLDAPVGYMASTLNLCQKRPELNFDDFWRSEKTELYHFIGKDIVYFHALFWPAMLKEAGYRLPTEIFTHGFLTVDGQKMSKSRGTYINARQYLQHLPAEYLRYYFASKLGQSVEDIDFNTQDFILKINSDLVGKVVNIASRLANLLNKHFDNTLLNSTLSQPLWQACLLAKESIDTAYENREFNKATRLIMNLADQINAYIDEEKPWILAKDTQQKTKLHEVCTLGLNAFKVLIGCLKPILPETAKRVEHFLAIPAFTWDNLSDTLSHRILPYEPLLQRIDNDRIQAMKDAQAALTTPPPAAPSAPTPSLMKSEINYDTFDKIDLRIAKILAAEAIPEADKLLKITVDVGELGHKTLFAGIKRAYTPEALIGKLTLVIVNLTPRKMRFGTSEAMILVAGAEDGSGLWLLEPQEGAQAGMRVK